MAASALLLAGSAGLRVASLDLCADEYLLLLARALLDEQRRPRHSGSVAVDGSQGRLSYGAAIAYTGARIDTDFDQFPAPRIRLGAYWLASARLAYRVTKAAELTLRVANAFDDRYQAVLGYRTEGRSVHGGIRLAFGR